MVHSHSTSDCLIASYEFIFFLFTIGRHILHPPALYLESYEMSDNNQPKQSHLCDATRKEKSSSSIRVCVWLCVFFFFLSLRSIPYKKWSILDHIAGGAECVCVCVCLYWVKARSEFTEMKWQSNKAKAIVEIYFCFARRSNSQFNFFGRFCQGWDGDGRVKHEIVVACRLLTLSFLM